MDPLAAADSQPAPTPARARAGRSAAPPEHAAARATQAIALATAPSPLGEISFALSGDLLCVLGFEVQRDQLLARLGRRFKVHPARAAESPVIARVRDALARYFAGELRALEALPLDGGGTHFQTAVWSALREIPAGETRSYGQIAARIGKPRAVRAVGLANGKNPIALAVPCHRVIGADGSLTGYAGGLERKRWLLEHERRQGRPDEPLKD